MSQEQGVEKSAMLLLSIGENEAAEVLKLLGPREVQKIGAAMAKLQSVPREKIEVVIDELRDKAQDGAPVTADEQQIRAMLTKALGDDRAANLLSRILQGGETAGIESLKWLDAGTVAELIKNEHPQVIATILVHLEYDHAGEIIKFFTERLQNDVILRIATLDGVQPAALQALNDSLTRVMSGASRVKKTQLGGVRSAAEVLNYVGSAIETRILSSIMEYDEELSQKIVDEMFVFENLMDMEDRALQVLMREVSQDALATALKGTSESMQDKVFRNMSQRAAQLLREAIEMRGPVRLSEVEQQQKDILKLARKLAEDGQIVLSSKGGEDAFV